MRTSPKIHFEPHFFDLRPGQFHPMSAKRKTRHEIRGDWKSTLLGKLLGWAMKLMTATLRVDLHNPGRIGDPSTPVPPMILMLWHSRFFVVPGVWLKMLRTKRRVSILTSASRDGDMVANAMAVFGFEAIRGSSSRRAVAALVGLKRALEAGRDVCPMALADRATKSSRERSNSPKPLVHRSCRCMCGFPRRGGLALGTASRYPVLSVA